MTSLRRTTEPTERSRPPASMTIVSPIAATPTTEIWMKTLRTLPGSR
jgi:hypothetical protein